jgi:hypothetical protein
MMTKVFLVLILSFGPLSQVKYLDTSLKSLVLLQADFQEVDFPEIIGLVPTIPTTLNVVTQAAPLFAGAIPHLFFLLTEKLAYQRQKYELRGIIEEEILYL